VTTGPQRVPGPITCWKRRVVFVRRGSPRRRRRPLEGGGRLESRPTRLHRSTDCTGRSPTLKPRRPSGHAVYRALSNPTQIPAAGAAEAAPAPSSTLPHGQGKPARRGRPHSAGTNKHARICVSIYASSSSQDTRGATTQHAPTSRTPSATRNLVNASPVSALVNPSAAMSSVGTYSRATSPRRT